MEEGNKARYRRRIDFEIESDMKDDGVMHLMD
jgi:hypothetical protein